MREKHNFVRLAEVQQRQQTSFNVGLDPHGFGSHKASLEIYSSAVPPKFSSEYNIYMNRVDMYGHIMLYSGVGQGLIRQQMAELLASVEFYIKKIITIYIEKARVFTFKPQAAFYEQFGPAGMIMLAEIRRFISKTGMKVGEKTVTTLDCKRGDIFTTQGAYFNAYIGDLTDDWGVEYAPYDFEIMNITPWMGEDVMVLYDKGKPAKGLKLMKAGKGIIIVNKTSNPSSPQYQELVIQKKKVTLQMLNVADMKNISQWEKLENRGLSTIGLVVGSTHVCDGSIRLLFPGTTLLVPGFGAQGGSFEKIILEMIREERWNGQGAIFSSSRGSMYPFLAKYGGSGDPKNFENDAIKAVTEFRKAEKKAYQARNVVQAGIGYPYSKEI